MAEDVSICFILSALRFGLTPHINAPTPDVIGAAIEVPLSIFPVVSTVIFSPGAYMSTLSPQIECSARLLSLVELPTIIILLRTLLSVIPPIIVSRVQHGRQF